MSSFLLGLRIWFFTICYSTILIFVIFLFIEGWSSAVIAILFFLVALIITSPAILIVHFSLWLARQIPYDVMPKAVWLSFFLVLLALAITISTLIAASLEDEVGLYVTLATTGGILGCILFNWNRICHYFMNSNNQNVGHACA